MATSALSGLVTLVTGTSGVIGSGVARQLLLQGATVVAPVRSERSLSKVEEEVAQHAPDRLDAFVADLETEAGAQKTADQVKQKYGNLSHVVSINGPFWAKGELSDQSADEMVEQFKVFAVSHFLVYKYFAPLLKDSSESSFVFFTGGAGQGYMKGVSLCTVGVAGLFGISIAARGEYADKKPRVNEMRLTAFVKRDAQSDASKQLFSNHKVGENVAKLLESDTSGEVVMLNHTDLK